MLTPFQLNQLSQPVINVYSQLENDILTAIAERLKTDKDITKDNALKWQFDKLAQLNDLNKDVIKLIANMSGKSEKEISTLVQSSMQQSVDPMDKWLQKVADTGKIEKAVPLKQDTAVFNTLRMFQKQAKDNLNLINSTILANSGQVYRDILTQATAAVLSGFKSHHQALADASSKWAQKGVPALIDSAGRQWSIEGYVPLVTRTVSNNVANQTQWDRMDSYGLDLIEVTTVAGPRPGCAPYQGHIYSKNGRDKRYPPLSSTTYGQPAGLFGCNCHHTSYPYIPNVSVKRYEPVPLGEANAIYEQSQKQRYLERQIRKAKTEKSMMESLGNEEAIKKANQKIRTRQQNMRDFIRTTNRTRRYDREQIQN
ncbi:phage minor capsid protein [Sporolactobacillus sp. CQH2019]|uniref:phage minor capsid protein n=1 Tax=Sporolactobacillus sp. CQH2019 TaxID=3023512 RepID=UPI00236766C0|nr:phage minor capsid protein [Sporolactobacillus sp. CQH2019]MDD9147834.1 phage minor capsid protein [Sporolactobacillus sp. CQH2019]